MSAKTQTPATGNEQTAPAGEDLEQLVAAVEAQYAFPFEASGAELALLIEMRAGLPKGPAVSL